MDTATSMPALRRIRLELARTPEFPEGNSGHGYEFVAPVTEDAHIDPKAWKEELAERQLWDYALGDGLETDGTATQ